MAEVNRGRVRVRPRLGWIHGVKVAFCKREMTMDAVRKHVEDEKEWRALVHIYNGLSFTLAFLLDPIFILTSLPCSWGYHL